MFRFFTEKNWFVWSWIGSFIILSSLWVQVEIDVKINEWFGIFYDMIQKALAEPNAVSIEEYFASLFSFITLNPPLDRTGPEKVVLAMLHSLSWQMSKSACALSVKG